MGKCIRIGITGGIASGKSTCTRMLAELGFVSSIIDADKVAHLVYAPGTVGFNRIAKEFGSVVLSHDGTAVDRSALGKVVFSSKDSMKKLTDIVWPSTRELLIEKLSGIDACTNNTSSVVVTEAAMMVEAHWFDLFDVVIVMEVNINTARDRLVKRNGLSPTAADDRIASQLTNEERRDFLLRTKCDSQKRFFVDGGCCEEEVKNHLKEIMAGVTD